MALLRFDTGLDPIGALLRLQDELQRQMRNPEYRMGLSGHGAYPPINIFEAVEGAVLVAEAPGLDASRISIAGEGRTLTITGERTFERGGNGRGFHRRELSEGKFARSVQLPEDYDVSRAEARYEAGLLIIRVPKAEHAKPRQITVQSA